MITNHNSPAPKIRLDTLTAAHVPTPELQLDLVIVDGPSPVVASCGVDQHDISWLHLMGSQDFCGADPENIRAIGVEREILHVVVSVFVMYNDRSTQV